METTTHVLIDGEAFCWSVRDSYTGDLVIYIDTVGNTKYRPTLCYSAKGFLNHNDWYKCKYFTSIKTFRNYDISELPVEELQKLFEEEAL